DWMNAALRAVGFKTSDVMTPFAQLAMDLREIPVKLNAAMIIRSRDGDFLIEKPLTPVAPKNLPAAAPKVGTIKVEEVSEREEPKKVAIKDNLRGVWITDADFDDINDIAKLAKAQGLDTIFIPIFRAGQPIYPSKIFSQDKKFVGDDPLKKAIVSAHEQGMKLIGVVDATLWGDAEHPAPLVVASHPSIQDCNLLGRRYAEQEAWQNSEMHALDSKPAANVIPITEIKTSNKEIYLCPASSQAARLLKSLLVELNLNYELDGVCLERVDYPRSKPFVVAGQDLTPPFGYTVEVRKEMIRLHHIDPIDVDLSTARTDTDVQAVASWDKFRRGKLIGLLNELSKQFKSDNPKGIFAVTLDLTSDSQSPVHWAEIAGVDALIPRLTLAKAEGEDTYAYSQSDADAIVSLNRATLKAAAIIPAVGELKAEKLTDQITALSRAIKLAKDENLRGYILTGDVSGLKAVLEALGKQVP
ncbi:MAG: family 10 glycosylhydrolase, partial [Armatimonadota bacterium]|nr:family 10 glycosylhydrolase [Armatimonadota bacterium]